MERVLFAALFGTLIYTVALASAATLNIDQASLGSGSGAAASCDTDNVATTYQTTFTSGTGYTVTGVDVTNIAAACAGKTIGVTLTDATNNVLGSGGSATVPGGGGSVTVSVGGSPTAQSVEKAHVVIG